MLCRLPPRPSKPTLRMHAVQEAKNTRHATDLICNNMSPARRLLAVTLYGTFHPLSASYNAHAQRNVLLRASCGAFPGETKRSYLLQGSLVVGVSPRFTASMGTWIRLL